MGIALWIASGVVAGFLARIVPFRRRRLAFELLVSVMAALIGGVVATALDFGGWAEPDWRAAVFALLVAWTAIAVFRSLRAS